MASKEQKQAAQKNIEKARKTWQEMSPRERARRQPEGQGRTRPGKGGEGEYYRVVVRDKRQFQTFRTHDVGDDERVQRLAGQRSSGSWDTQAWLIPKDEAHVDDNGYLRADTEDVQEVLDQLGSQPRREEEDIFRADPRPDVPEEDKPTEAQKQARQENIKKAQEAQH